MKRLIVLLGCVLISGAVFAQKYIGKQKDIDIILKNTKAFSSYYVQGDYQKLSDCYSPDGKILPNGSDIIEGHENIANRFRVPEGMKILRHKVSPQEIRVVKKVAYDYGYYEGETQGRDGTTSIWRGKYVIIWKKEQKDWKIYLDIWNRIND
jgi:ketosteroid isomerase-like protein